MPNRLSYENSPYLQQHADNPVDWYPWGEDALATAHQYDKPIFLSIGYAACHWCHVMAHESFEDPEIAQLLNENFVNIKVDREERPDLDSIYMNSVVSMTGQGGWPTSIFLTPAGEPFFGGTYYPPVRRYNMPSFRDVLLAIIRAWKDDRLQLIQSARELTQQLRMTNSYVNDSQALVANKLDEAASQLIQSYAWNGGGWGRAPKFPQPMAIGLLLIRASYGDNLARQVTEHGLNAMAKGGMYDVLGGGFARYSTDDRWLVPHFEKMLYDNAQLARVYLHAYLITGNKYFRSICEATLDFMVREMMPPDSDSAPANRGFFSSIDADSEGVEGKYYVWSFDEIRQAVINGLGDSEDINLNLQIFVTAFGITEKGNFEGKVVLQRALDDGELAGRFNLTAGQIQQRLKQVQRILFQTRKSRIRPGTDDKVLTAWNALALIAFAEAARYLQRSDYLEIARQNAKFLVTELYRDDVLLRSWRQGKAQHNGYLEDYAALILALLSLYQSDPKPDWFNWANLFTNQMIINFKDDQGGFFDTRSDQDCLIIRPKDLQDNATPSGNALAALALLQISAYTGRGDLRDLAEQMLGAIQEIAVKHPLAFAQWLVAVDFALNPVKEVAILGDPQDEKLKLLVDELWKSYRPRLVAAISEFPPHGSSPTLLSERILLNNIPTAYVCQNMICLRPVNSADELADQLSLKPE